MKALTQHVQASYGQTKFKPFWDDLSDEYKDYVSQQRNLALVYYKSDKSEKFEYNSKGEKVLHVGDESSFGEYFGLKYRKNNIYNEVIFL